METSQNIKKSGEEFNPDEIMLSNKDLEIVRAEMAKGQFKLSGKDKLLSWTVLIVLLLAQVSN